MHKDVLAGLNKQLNKEFASWYVYLAMSSYFDQEDLPGFSAWMRVKAEEELIHAMKIYDYIGHRGQERTLTPIVIDHADWTSPVQAMKAALEHEHTDYATEVFLHWFVLEQVEEEAEAAEMVAKVKLAGADNLFVIDNYMSQRAAQDSATKSAESAE
jgi:ferritin